MFKLFSLIICIVLLSEIGYCYSDNDISRLEYQNFSHVFEDESIGERLNRLETSVFGMAQTGNIDDRIERLEKLSNNQKIPTRAVPYHTKQKSKIKNILNSAMDIFDSGTVTGFTPPLNSTGYGYSDNIYRNEFNNFLNNPQGYCPYYQRYYAEPNIYNQQIPYGNVNIPPVPPFLYSNHYPINRHYYQRRYTPPNILTRTGVHIIND